MIFAALVFLLITFHRGTNFHQRNRDELARHLLPPDHAIYESRQLLGRYMPILADRAEIFPPITLDHLYLSERDMFYTSYTYSIMTLTVIDDESRNRPALRPYLVVPRYHLINIMNKMMIRHAELRERGENESPEALAVVGLFNSCFILVLQSKQSFSQQAADAVKVFGEIAVRTTLNKWDADSQLRTIPRVANDLLEYYLITDEVQGIRSSSDVLVLLEAIKTICSRPGAGETFGESLLAISEGSRLIRSEAETKEEADPRHSEIIADMLTLARSA